MKAVTWHGVGDIRLEDVADPRIEEPTDAVVRITTSAICGTDLHFVRGTMPGLEPGVVLGHEAVGEVVEVGPAVRNFAPGDRVVVPSTIACGYCSYCRAGYYAQCDNANPGGRRAGTAFFGGPKAWFGGRLAEIGHGDTVAVFGCGPVGQLAIMSAYLQGAGRVIAVDGLDDRLAMAKAQHAEVVDFNAEDPVEAIVAMTGGIGADRVIDAVGVDAERPASSTEPAPDFDREREQVAPETDPAWAPGDAPTQAARWAVEAVAKAGTVGVIGVYPQTVTSYPFGAAMMKNLTVKAGNCNHRRYIPDLLALVVNGTVDPAQLLTRHEPMTDVLAAYRQFQDRDPGWLKVAVRATGSW